MRTSLVVVFALYVVRTVYGDCDRPTTGQNMILITDVTFPAPDGTTVTMQCEPGYKGMGSGTVACSGGSWSSLNLRCEKSNCGSAGEVVNGQVDYSEGTEFGAFARVICNEGYVVVGIENQIYCGLQGWTGRLATCEVVVCDAPDSIANGYFDPMKDQFEHSEVITYSCNGDYVLNGSKTASCENDRQFKPAPPKCVLVNCPDPKIDNGIVAAGARPPYKHQSSVTFRCKVGHDMKGRDTVSCDINSKWSPELPKCNPIECKAPEVTNGEVVDGSRLTYKYAETITVKCTEGFRLSGQSTLTCGEKSQWSAALPECTMIQCPTPVVQGGVLVGGQRPSYKYLDSVSFECNSGYVLSGESTLTCDENSQWSPKLPKCTQVVCSAPEVTNGQVVEGQRPTYRFSDSVVLECKSGYTMSGQSALTCELNSQWSPQLPQCTQVACSSPEVTNGQVVEGQRPTYRFSDSVVFECKSGYTMSGQSALTCELNSQWSPQLPQCTQNDGHTVKIVLSVLGASVATLVVGLFVYFGVVKKRKGAGKQYTGAPQEAESVALS